MAPAAAIIELTELGLKAPINLDPSTPSSAREEHHHHELGLKAPIIPHPSTPSSARGGETPPSRPAIKIQHRITDSDVVLSGGDYGGDAEGEGTAQGEAVEICKGINDLDKVVLHEVCGSSAELITYTPNR